MIIFFELFTAEIFTIYCSNLKYVDFLKTENGFFFFFFPWRFNSDVKHKNFENDFGGLFSDIEQTFLMKIFKFLIQNENCRISNNVV